MGTILGKSSSCLLLLDSYPDNISPAAVCRNYARRTKYSQEEGAEPTGRSLKRTGQRKHLAAGDGGVVGGVMQEAD